MFSSPIVCSRPCASTHWTVPPDNRRISQLILASASRTARRKVPGYRDGPEPCPGSPRFADIMSSEKKHESTKTRILSHLFLFRVFVLSCFRDSICVYFSQPAIEPI